MSLHWLTVKTCTARTQIISRYISHSNTHCRPFSITRINPQVKHLHAAISYKHKRMLDKEKADRDTTVGVVLGVGLTLAAVGLSFLLAGPKGKK